MLTIIATLLVQTAFAVPFPPPTGPYHVGYTQHVFNHTTPNDPVAPPNASSVLLGTLYYPTAEIPIPGNNTAPYLDPTTAALWGNILQYPNDSSKASQHGTSSKAYTSIPKPTNPPSSSPPAAVKMQSRTTS